MEIQTLTENIEDKKSISERKSRVLMAVIKTYLETGEPVGSRTISKNPDIKASPATIRNEMADLEELGYIFSPHASAGRIPTDNGYRFYVDSLLEDKEQEVKELKENILEKADKLDKILKNAADILAHSTNYPAMIAASRNNANKIKFIQTSKVDEFQLLVVVVSEANQVINKVIKLKDNVENDDVLKINILLNTYLDGIEIENINMALMKKIMEQAGNKSSIIEDILSVLLEAVEINDREVYTSGAKNIFKYPELSDKETAEEIISAFEEKQEFATMVVSKSQTNDKHPIKVYIGGENDSEKMKDCSIVTATCELEEGVTGTIGIVGPKRMDYKKVMSSIKTLINELGDIYHNK